MGMYDVVHIYKAWLPSYEAMNVKREWQTKSCESILDIITIDKNGIVSAINQKLLPNIMEIHTYENGIYWSFLLHIENGKLISIKENNRHV